MTAAKAFVALIRAPKKIAERKWSFLAVFIVVLIVTVSICSATGFIPDPVSASTASSTPSTNVETSPLVASAITGNGTAAPLNGQINMSGDLPVHIIIPSIGVNATVANPDTLDVNALDNYLSYGAARYPTSATLGEQGNMILFGHSSYLPIVYNKAYKTFDGIQNLKPGDQIDVYSTTKEYVYSVDTEQKESETSDSIPLTDTGYTLTLSTCDSFTVKTDRFIVTATLVGSYPLGSTTQ